MAIAFATVVSLVAWSSIASDARPRPAGVTHYPDGASSVTAIDVGPDGNIWFGGMNRQGGTHAKPSFLGRLDPASGKVTKFTFGALNDDDVPLSIINGPDGNLWFGYANDSGVQQLATSTIGGTITTFTIGMQNPVVGPDGAIWGSLCSQSCAQWEAFGRVTTSGHTSTVYLDDLGLGPFIVGPDAEFWYCASSAIVAVNVHGGIRKKYATNSPCSGRSDATRPLIVYGPDGNVYSNADGGLTQTTPDGAMTTLFTDPDLLQLQADAVDGSIWFEDAAAHKLHEYLLAAHKTVTYMLPPDTQASVFTVDHSHTSVWFAQSQANRGIFRLSL